MLNKKVIIGIGVFIAAGLLAFTFANPNNNEEDTLKDETKEVEKVSTTKETDSVVEKPTVVETTNPTTPVVRRVNNPTVDDGKNKALADLKSLLDSLNHVKEDYTSESFKPYSDLLEKAKDVSDNTTTEINNLITNIKEATNNLVELKLLDLTISNKENVYKRLEKQEDLTFTAIYNDGAKNKEVTVTTDDEFDSSAVITDAIITYSYSDKYGKDIVVYTYSVIANDKDNAINALNELIDSIVINDKDYTSDSVKVLRDLMDDAKNTDELTAEEIIKLISDIKKAKNELVKIQLVELTISNSYKEYKRLDKAEKLVFTAVYNDITRNKEVKATSKKRIDTSKVVSNKTITFNYNDEYGTAKVSYKYSVVLNDMDLALAKLNKVLGKVHYNEIDYTSDSYKELKVLLSKVIFAPSMKATQINDLAEKIEVANGQLVKLQLLELKISNTNKEYKRLDKQERLSFTAIYNDAKRNQKVNAKSKDIFNSSVITNNSEMTYTYSDKYGSASVAYKYSVVANDKDNAIKALQDYLDTLNIKEEDYTSASYKELKEILTKTSDLDKLKTKDIKNLLEDIKKAVNKLVELKLTGLKISSNNDVYGYKETQKELIFTALYNDDTRDKTVTATTSDTFNSKDLKTSEMIYTYTDNYGTATIIYAYKVVDKDAPEIVLNGKTTQIIDRSILAWAKYTDPGYTVNDLTETKVTTTICFAKPYADTCKNVNKVDIALGASLGVYKITYTATDAYNNASSVTRTVKVKRIIDDGNSDLNININGSEKMSVEYLSEYTDAGAVGYDYIDGKLANRTERPVTTTILYKNSEVVENIDTSVLGLYYVKYTVKDWIGNSYTKTRSVNIVDTVAPVIVATGNTDTTEHEGIRVTVPTVTVSDNYSKKENITMYSEFVFSYKKHYDGRFIRTYYVDKYITGIMYKATDESGNVSTITLPIDELLIKKDIEVSYWDYNYKY